MKTSGKWRYDKEIENKMKTTTKKERKKKIKKIRPGGPIHKQYIFQKKRTEKLEESKSKKGKKKTHSNFLVVQWLRTCSAVHRTWVRSLLGN